MSSMSNKSRMFVTGAAGMIGSNIAAALLADGHEVIGVDNLWRGSSRNLEPLRQFPHFSFRHADIAADRNWAADLGHEDSIVHTADIVAGIGFVFQNEWTVFQKNLLINTEIARIVHFQQPARLLYLGTACSYPQGLQRSTEGSVLREELKYPADPESGYGWSKLMGDLEFHLAVKGGRTRLTVLDLHNVYGWPCIYRDSTAQVIPALVMKALASTDGSLTVWGNGRQGRAFLHVNDVVSAVRAALHYEGPHDNFMIGPDHCTTIAEVAELIRAHPGINVERILYDTTKPTGDIGRYADASRAKAELGWAPSVEFRAGLHDLVERISADWADWNAGKR